MTHSVSLILAGWILTFKYAQESKMFRTMQRYTVCEVWGLTPYTSVARYGDFPPNSSNSGKWWGGFQFGFGEFWPSKWISKETNLWRWGIFWGLRNFRTTHLAILPYTAGGTPMYQQEIFKNCEKNNFWIVYQNLPLAYSFSLTVRFHLTENVASW